jgi:hypothetical protein
MEINEWISRFQEELVLFTYGKLDASQLQKTIEIVSSFVYDESKRDKKLRKIFKSLGIEKVEHLTNLIFKIATDYTQIREKHKKTHGSISQYPLKSFFKDMARYAVRRYGENYEILIDHLTKLI